MKERLSSLTVDQLRHALEYDAATGVFHWRNPSSFRCKVGQVAGNIRSDGYVVITVLGTRYFAHRLAWLYQSGDWPAEDVDHIDGNPSNNAFANLRSVTHGQNTLNSRQRPPGVSGLRGVTLHTKTGLWNARIRINGRQRSLGYFKCKAEASEAYLRAVKDTHGPYSFLKGVGREG